MKTSNLNEETEISELRQEGWRELDFWEQALNGQVSPEEIVGHKAPNFLLQGAYDEDDYGDDEDYD